jgi:hypothetical protein
MRAIMFSASGIVGSVSIHEVFAAIGPLPVRNPFGVGFSTLVVGAAVVMDAVQAGVEVCVAFFAGIAKSDSLACCELDRCVARKATHGTRRLRQLRASCQANAAPYQIDGAGLPLNSAGLPPSRMPATPRKKGVLPKWPQRPPESLHRERQRSGPFVRSTRLILTRCRI